jgi:hypothetical protein
VFVRTTITLTADAELLVKRAMRQRGASLKTVVNEAIVKALSDRGRPAVSLPTFDMGEPLVDLDHTGRLLAELDVEDSAAGSEAGPAAGSEADSGTD